MIKRVHRKRRIILGGCSIYLRTWQHDFLPTTCIGRVCRCTCASISASHGQEQWKDSKTWFDHQLIGLHIYKNTWWTLHPQQWSLVCFVAGIGWHQLPCRSWMNIGGGKTGSCRGQSKEKVEKQCATLVLFSTCVLHMHLRHVCSISSSYCSSVIIPYLLLVRTYPINLSNLILLYKDNDKIYNPSSLFWCRPRHRMCTVLEALHPAFLPSHLRLRFDTYISISVHVIDFVGN